MGSGSTMQRVCGATRSESSMQCLNEFLGQRGRKMLSISLIQHRWYRYTRTLDTISIRIEWWWSILLSCFKPTDHLFFPCNVVEFVLSVRWPFTILILLQSNGSKALSLVFFEGGPLSPHRYAPRYKFKSRVPPSKRRWCWLNKRSSRNWMGARDQEKVESKNSSVH